MIGVKRGGGGKRGPFLAMRANEILIPAEEEEKWIGGV